MVVGGAVLSMLLLPPTKDVSGEAAHPTAVGVWGEIPAA